MKNIKASPLEIVVLDRGWVFVGNTTRKAETLEITNARCVRVWGTTNGIGQLALTGPTPSTRLDPAGNVSAPLKSVILTIACKTDW